MSYDRPSKDPKSEPRVSYERPPVTETSLGIQFSPVPGWDVHFFGLFGERVKLEYPLFESAAPVILDPQSPVFLSRVPKIRGLYTSEARTDLVQIQDDFFFVNWRKTAESTGYPGYPAARARFINQWSTFRGFLASFGIESPAIRRYQVTYVNHSEQNEIPPGDLLTNWKPPAGSEPGGFSLSTTYRLANREVDVTIAMQPAVRTVDNVSITQTTITTSRNLPDGVARLDPAIELDELHRALIETFQSITSPAAKTHWRPE